MGMAFNGLQRNPNQQFGQGYDPISGTMSLSNPPSQQDFRLPADITAAPSKPGFNDQGGTGDKLRRLAAHLMMAGGNNQGGNTLLSQLQQQNEAASQDDYRRQQLALQGQIANTRADTEPAVIKTLRAAGIDPTSEYGKSLIASNINRPIIVGNGDTGFTAMGGAFGTPGSGGGPASGGGGQPGVPTVTDAASYAAIPSGSQFRDPEGNIRVKP